MEIKPTFCTFIFGNGFDLSLGMRTEFKDMYEGYINSPSIYQKNQEKKWIAKFKRYIDADKPKYETWSDFELALGRYSKYCDSVDELIKCERDFKVYLKKYLRKEEEKMLKIIAKSPREYILAFSDFCNNFYRRNDLTENEKNQINLYFKKSVFSYISFNYTQRIFNSLVSRQQPLFVHGTLENDIILGLDNESQISFPLDAISKRAIIKPVYNETVDLNKVNTIKNIFGSSNIICSYGLSFGASDFTWIKEISNVLIYKNCLWVHYILKNEEINFVDLIESLEYRENLKKDFLRKIGIPREIYKKISDKVYIFPIAKSPFKFPQQTSDDLENEIKEILNQVN